MNDKEKIADLTYLVMRMGNEINRLKNELLDMYDHVGVNNLPHQIQGYRQFILDKSRIALSGGQSAYTSWELEDLCESHGFGRGYWMKGIKQTHHY